MPSRRRALAADPWRLSMLAAMNTSVSLRGRLLRRPVRWLLAPIFRAGRSPVLRRRSLLRIAAMKQMPLPIGTRVRSDTLRGVPVEWVEQSRKPASRVILYLHGGAYVVGAPRVYRELNARLALGAQARVLAVDYRLAPEHPFPAALEDAVAVYRALLERGTAASDIVIAGDSAGGGLSLACALRLRELELPLPAALLLFSPWTDLALSGDSLRDCAASELVLDIDGLREGARDYLAGQDARTPLASPLYADLRGLPPTLIQVTDTEMLYDDARRLAAAIEAAGGTVSLRVWPQLWHVWQVFVGLLPEADAAVREATGFILRHTPRA